MRILVLGASGMAGHVMAETLERGGHDITRVAGTRKATPGTVILDMTDPTALGVLLLRAFDVVINCVGVLLPSANRDRARTAYINSYLPHRLERELEGTPTRLVHLSTDCVFTGDRGGYVEADHSDATHFYGRSKALGDVVNGKDLTIRASIIGPELGPDGSGLFHWLAGQDGTVKGFTRALWNGVTTIELARAINAALNQGLTGLYHLTPPETITKADLLTLIGGVFGFPATVEPVDGEANDKTLIDTRRELAYRPPGYREMVEDMRAWVEDHPGWYPHYVERMTP